MHKINLKKHVTKETFHLKESDKGDFYLLSGITSLLLESLKLLYILRFLVFLKN